MPELLFSRAKASVEKIWINEKLSRIDIESEKCSASISLYGGHVLQWQPKGHKPVFWLSDQAVFEQGKAIRGGIPICWPWFGPFPDEMLLNHNENTCGINSHGFARTSLWQFKQVKETEHGIEIEITLSGENEHPAWPFCFELTQRLIFGDNFSQALSIKNLGLTKRANTETLIADQPLTDNKAFYTGALHSYFAVGSAQETSINSLAGIDFEDKIAKPCDSNSDENRPLSNLNNIEQCLGPIDRIYHSAKDLTINDKANKRKITLTTEHTHQWVLWNPGVKIAGQMSDVHTNAENEFVCLEAANTIPIALSKGKEVTISQHISVEHNE
ncbi:MAG: D-hexose-6-phosphate mutarotase [Colwellia sp.]